MIKVISTENMRKSEAAAIEKSLTAFELISRAGLAIFEAVDWKPPVAVVCGGGNNAADGFATASRLKTAGIDVTLFLLSDRLTEDGRYFFDECTSIGVEMKQGLENLSLDGYNTVLDCIFGIGFRGDEISDPYKTAIERINESGAYVVSADINSGLVANSGLAGEDDDGACVRSNLTVSLGSFKSGHFLNSAKDYIENKVNRDIGIESVGDAAYLIEPSDIRRIFCGRLQNSNKGDYGYVAIIGGSVEYSGAAKLANLALSALRSGAGVSKLAVPRCITKAVLPYILESTLYELDDIDGQFCFSHGAIDRLLYHTRAAAVGMGMGRSDEVKRLLEYMLCEYSGRLIIDADGLNVLAGMDIKYFKNASCRLILTPHPKEFERLYGKKFDECRHDLVTAAKEYAKNTGTILLLKGTTTIITDGNTVYLSDSGDCGMATAGSGDVLSGILAGICGYVSDDDLLLGVAAGAYLNGLAGALASREIPSVAMISGDTVRHIPDAMREIIG